MKEDIMVVYPFGETDAGFQTPDNFEKDIDEFYERGYRCFHFDHFHELEGANANDTNQKLAEVWAKKFQDICKTKYKDIWMYVYAQPNGAAAAKSLLRRSDISGSKVITQKCEYFISLNREVTVNKDTKQVEVNQENRNVTFWLDKSRTTSKQHIGTHLYFGKDGNYYEDQETAGEVPGYQSNDLTMTDVQDAFGIGGEDDFADF
jgi:hypothetical protein